MARIKLTPELLMDCAANLEKANGKNEDVINRLDNIIATNIKYHRAGTSFDVIAKDKIYGHFDLPIYAKHQLLDALAAISVCYYENIDSELVNKYLSTFKGAKRSLFLFFCYI